MNRLKKFELSVNNPMFEESFYVESTEENPLFEGGQLNSFGYVMLSASKNIDMSDKFTISVSPDSCSLIKITEIK